MTTERCNAKQLKQACKIGGLAILITAVQVHKAWSQSEAQTAQKACNAIVTAAQKAIPPGGSMRVTNDCAEVIDDEEGGLVFSYTTGAGVTDAMVATAKAIMKTIEKSCNTAKGTPKITEGVPGTFLALDRSIECMWDFEEEEDDD
jgi:hypothetical protein